MQTVMPIISVDDIESVKTFYEDVLKLNITMEMSAPDGSLFMITVDNGHEAGLMFMQAHPESPNPKALSPEGLVIYLLTDNVEAYHDKIDGGNGLTLVEPLTDQFWGDRTFIVRDPWGLHLQFAQNLGQMSAPPEGFDVKMAQPVG